MECSRFTDFNLESCCFTQPFHIKLDGFFVFSTFNTLMFVFSHKGGNSSFRKWFELSSAFYFNSTKSSFQECHYLELILENSTRFLVLESFFSTPIFNFFPSIMNFHFRTNRISVTKMEQNPFEAVLKNYFSLSQCVQNYISRVFPGKKQDIHGHKQLISDDLYTLPEVKGVSLDPTPSIRVIFQVLF